MDVVVLKAEIFPDTAEVAVKKALEMRSGSRRPQINLAKRREVDRRSHNDEHAETTKTN